LKIGGGWWTSWMFLRNWKREERSWDLRESRWRERKEKNKWIKNMKKEYINSSYMMCACLPTDGQSWTSDQSDSPRVSPLLTPDSYGLCRLMVFAAHCPFYVYPFV
jgi:hypothetical protein